ncbi:phosphoribosylglycinamide formyltransferase [Pseudohoeflea coraliihabitans]|uniref:Phosphoribosylglycinamide formyltransferase n=1 Tax=Pseudohoeflea coraliihabitans TaxID=2860393 RepID=A0ABS6WS30_9HYPH|nr:phosphoribosylglycinamide formyltransferase [Pseudohoeflea sp. DP4N28-3]MBW3098741.1 phosphoribosylglycinamide formyltransferase [Pseudohoeflea sp. DP4N28-3]
MTAPGPNAAKRRVGILISGRGSNMDALIAATMRPDYPARIVTVLSDRADAAGLQRAQSLDIAAVAVPRADFSSKADHEAALLDRLAEARVDFVCLAGFMRILSADFVRRWEGRMINIHPSLLPAFKGLDTHHRALAAGTRVHGASVHFVTAEMDEGPVIAQAAVPVLNDDTPETLGARVLSAEHQLYPQALSLLAEGHVRMSGDGLATASAPTRIVCEDGRLIVSG